MGKIKWHKVNERKKLTKDRIDYDNGASVARAKKILAQRLITTMFRDVKPLFQWTDEELYQLGMTVKKEWMRRRRNITYKNAAIVKTKKMAPLPDVTGRAVSWEEFRAERS